MLESVIALLVILVILILKSVPRVCGVDMVQLFEPSFAVLEEITLFTAPAFNNSMRACPRRTAH